MKIGLTGAKLPVKLSVSVLTSMAYIAFSFNLECMTASLTFYLLSTLISCCQFSAVCQASAATTCATWSAVPTEEAASQTALMASFASARLASGERFVKRVSHTSHITLKGKKQHVFCNVVKSTTAGSFVVSSSLGGFHRLPHRSLKENAVQRVENWLR